MIMMWPGSTSWTTKLKRGGLCLYYLAGNRADESMEEEMMDVDLLLLHQEGQQMEI